ncbi:MAG: hypothetical protein QM784_03990 [Polyangiaceae bacterium]
MPLVIEASICPGAARLGSFLKISTAFWKQQLKWAAGMTDLLVRHYLGLCRRFDTLGRVHYLLVSTYYVGAVAAALNLLLPIVFLSTGECALEISLTEFLLHIAPFVTMSACVQLVVQRWYSHREERGIPWRSMLLERATWHVYLSGFIAGLLGMKVPYVPTPKDGSRRVPLPLLLPHIALIGASLIAIGWASATSAHTENGTALMMTLALVNALLLVPGLVTGLRSHHPSSRAPS